MNSSRIVIAGTQSGAGKTSVSLALMEALSRAGRRVQAFKVGPDYIDPSYHAIATGQPSHNLDSWMLSKETIQWLFQKHSQSADISVIEGVMGLFDGLGAVDEAASTAQMAKILKAPVVLVMDAGGMSRSAAAMVKGYRDFDPELNMKGVILNRVGSDRHFNLLKEAIEHYTDVAVLGCIMKDAKAQIPERHLGLVTAGENKGMKVCLDALATGLRIDLDLLVKIAAEAPALPQSIANAPAWTASRHKVRIGIARDEAFSFYYQANLDLLSEMNAEIVPFSPLKDKALPDDCAALYFGGGFPEIYARELDENHLMKSQIRSCIADGMPVYAECGGLMYLSESIETLGGNSFAMAGAVPGKIKMTERLQNFGYKEGLMAVNTTLGTKGEKIRGHEFHYSQRILDQEISQNIPYELQDRKSGKKQLEGYSKGSLLASYLHLHFLTNPKWASQFIASAGFYRRQHKEIVVKQTST